MSLDASASWQGGLKLGSHTAAPPRLRLNPALQISRFDGVGRESQMLYVLADPEGGSRQISLPYELHNRLLMLAPEGCLGRVLEQLAAAGEPPDAIQRFRSLVLDYLRNASTPLRQ